MSVVFATTRVAVNTATGNQDITTAKLGGLTPKLARFFLANVTADNTASAGGSTSVGAATGTSEQFCNYGFAADGVTPTDSLSAISTSSCIALFDPATATLVAEAAFVEFIADGVRINWTTAPPAAYLLVVEFLAGTDVNVKAGSTSLGNTVDLVTDITTVGFTADVVLTQWRIDGHDRRGYGIVHNDAGSITQYAYGMISTDNAGTSSEAARITNSGGIISVSGGGAAFWTGVFSDFDASGFSVTTVTSGGSFTALNWIAISFNGAVGVSLHVYTTPIVTGNHASTAPAFTPQYLYQIQSLAEFVNGALTDNRAGTIALGLIDASDAYSISYTREDAATTSNTQALIDDVAVHVPEDDGSNGVVATLASFDANGYTLNYSVAPAVEKDFVVLAIEEGPALATIEATSAITFGALTGSSAATLPIDAEVAATLGALVASSSATLPVSAEATLTLGALTISTFGAIGSAVNGEVDIVLGALVAASTGTTPLSAEVSATLGALVLASHGGVPGAGGSAPQRQRQRTRLGLGLGL